MRPPAKPAGAAIEHGRSRGIYAGREHQRERNRDRSASPRWSSKALGQDIAPRNLPSSTPSDQWAGTRVALDCPIGYRRPCRHITSAFPVASRSH
jgi:hypothetical protein